MAKSNTIFWVIGIAVFLFLILPNIQNQQKDVGIKVHYYDENKKEIIPEKSLFSIVTPPGGSYDYISLSISGSTNRQNGYYGNAGNNGLSGSSTSTGTAGFCIACWIDKIF